MVGASAGAADVHGGDGDANIFIVITFDARPISVSSFGSDDDPSGARLTAPALPGDSDKLGG